MSKNLKALRTQLDYMSANVANLPIKNCGESSYTPKNFEADNESFERYYFKIFTYSKENSSLIYNNYIGESLKFTDNGNIQVKNGTDPKYNIPHNFCNGNNLCLTDSGNIQNTNTTVKEEHTVYIRNPITNVKDRQPLFVFNKTGQFILKFNYKSSQNKKLENLKNVTLHINPYYQDYNLEDLSLFSYYAHCANTNYRDPNCACINTGVDNSRGNMCFASLYRGFDNSCLMKKVNSNGQSPFWRDIRIRCPVISKLKDKRDTCYLRDSEQMKSRVKQAIYDKFRNEFDKAKEITYNVCASAFDGDGNLTIGKDLVQNCQFNSKDGANANALNAPPGCSGGKVKDQCGVCGGDNSSCAGCDGIANSGKKLDACGKCGGDGSSCAGTGPSGPSGSGASQNTPPESKKKLNKTYIIIIIAVVVVLLALGYFFFF